MTDRYITPNAYRVALTNRLKARSKSTGENYQYITRRFVMERFLARVFNDQNDSRWLLKGGTGLLFRLPRARFSHDLDLYYARTLDEALEHLRDATRVKGLDHFTFDLTAAKRMTNKPNAAELTVIAYLGRAEYHRFTIDLTTGSHPAEADIVAVEPFIDLEDTSAPPPNRIYPLHLQIADKVCAMYETHGEAGAPSSRYRDLVDLVLIVESMPLDYQALHEAVRAESGRRGLPLPNTLISPHLSWVSEYPKFARSSNMLADPLNSLEAALTYVGQCLNPVLDGGDHLDLRWAPGGQHWSPER